MRDYRAPMRGSVAGWKEVGVYLQATSGQFAAEQLMAVGDINSDGRPDVVAADSGLTIMLHR